MVERITGWYREQGLLLRVGIGAVAGLAVILACYGLWSFLLAFVHPHTVAQRTSFIQMVVGGVGGLTLIAGLLITLRGQNKNQKTTLDQLATAHQQLDLTRQGQITDRFKQAIDQLGKTDDKDPPNKIEEVRLGGIYALAQIAVDDPDHYHWPIMQVFAAYLRRYASWQGHPSKIQEPTADIQTVLDVIGRRTRYYEAGEDERLDLIKTDFSNHVFPDGAHLEGAWLTEARFENANLSGAQLQKADLRGAHLEGAFLANADLREADLGNAILTATYLPGAKLQGVKNLDPNSLEEANGDYATEIGETTRPKWWGYLPGNGTSLEPGDYSVKVWKTLVYFSYLGDVSIPPGKNWYSDLFLPYSFSLTLAGVYFGGSSIYFCSGPWVCDPQRPKEDYALETAPKSIDAWIAWFENHPSLRLAKEPYEWENSPGSVSGMQFDAEVKPDTPDDEIGMGVEGPMVLIFPSSPRFGSLGLTKGKKMRVIVLEHNDETMLILTFSPANEFDQCKERVDKEVLANLYLGKKPVEQPEGG